MSFSARSSSLRSGDQRRPQAPGFSLVEVILALGIMAIAITSIIGLIGPTLGAVKEAQEMNAATACIAKMNALLESSTFFDGDLPSESVYSWVALSTSTSPTTFIFFDELPKTLPTNSVVQPTENVARWSVGTPSFQTPNPAITNNPIVSMEDFVEASNEARISGPVIAMTLSPSPLMGNFPTTGVVGDESHWYQAPPNNGIFPSVSGTFPQDPTGNKGNSISALYPEGYLPIYVQVFVVPMDSLQGTTTAGAFGQQLIDSLTPGNRIFTYTTAKLR